MHSRSIRLVTKNKRGVPGLSKTERAVFDAALERSKNEFSLIAYRTGLDRTFI